RVTTLSAVDDDVSGTTVLTPGVSTFTVTAALASRLQLVLPGETPQPGTGAGLARGVTGTPNTVRAGDPFNVTLNITDGFWNPVTTASSTVKIFSEDPNNASTGPWTSNGKDPVTITLTTGTFSFPMSLITASS